MEDTDSFYGSFNVRFDGGFLSINPEMAPAKRGFNPTGRYFVYCLHPRHGSCHFIAEQDEHGNWFSSFTPPFISNELIAAVGTCIERYNTNK